MEFRRNVLLKIIIPVVIIAPCLMWFTLTPAVYEKKLDIKTPLSYEHVSKVVKNPKIDLRYEEREVMIVKKKRTLIPFVSKTIDTVYATGKRIWWIND